MIIKCDSCKTEYNIKRLKSSKVECAICGHIWNIGIRQRYNISSIILSLCALLSALIFSLIITKLRYESEKKKTLSINITSVKTYIDDNIKKLKINYTIKNQTKYIHGIPNFNLIMKNKDNKIISKQKIFSPIPTLEANTNYNNFYILSKPLKGTKKLNLEFIKG